MIEIVEQEYDSALEYTNEVIDEFGERCGQPFGWSQFAFEALSDGNTVGAIVGYRLYDWLYIEFITVEESSRRLGVGGQLMDRAESLAAEMGLEGVALDTFRYHQAAEYYKTRGYVEHMVIPGKVPERDRIYLRKKLDV